MVLKLMFLLIVSAQRRTSILSSICFTEYEPGTQIALPEGALARLGKGSAEAIAFSPDGNTLAVAGSIGIWLYDVRAFNEVSLLTGHKEKAQCVAFSPNGNMLASGSWDKTVYLWDVSTRKHIGTLKHTGGVLSIAFSPDGNMLASGCGYPIRHDGSHPQEGDETVRLWDVSTRKHLATFNGHAHYVRSVAFSSNGKILATGSDDKTIRLWDVATGENISILKGHTGRVSGVAFNTDGTILASSGGNGR